MKLDKKFPDSNQLWNEHGELTEVHVTFEWKPMQCQYCKGMGHSAQLCRVKRSKQVWVLKQFVQVVKGIVADQEA